MSSRFATNVWCFARTTSVDPSQREAVWLLMEWPHARKQRRTLPRPRCRRTCHGASSFGESSSGGRTERVYEDAKESLGWITTRGRSFRGWNPPWCPCAGCFAFIVAERSRAFPPRPEKLPRGKRRIVTTVRTANPPGAALPGFLHHCAPGRRARPGHMVTPMPPVSQTAIDGPAWCTCP